MTVNNVIIVGGGLVGALAGCYFAKRGWDVSVYEKRADTRLEKNRLKKKSKSINLSISTRGLSAVERLDPELLKKVASITVPAYGRMVHEIGGKTVHAIRYSENGDYTSAVNRDILNQVLLTQLETYKNVKVYFEHKLETCDLKSKTARFRDLTTGECINTRADLIIGADGAYSKVRQRLQSSTRINLEQKYIDHAYCELLMQPKNNEFALDPDYVHIWPRETFLLLALPNIDKSFTCTLFMPLETFDSIQTYDDLVHFFEKNFPDTIELFGEEALKRYFENPKGDLFYIKTNPHHYSGNGLIVGDAAHCTVPFYAQGMNCGFEDIETLDVFLVEQAKMASAAKVSGANQDDDDDDVKTNKLTPQQIEAALIKYSACRPKDSAAMIDLALYNYTELRSGVNNPMVTVKIFMERKLSYWFPNLFCHLYSMVSFSKLSYSEATRRWKEQNRMINSIIMTSIGLSATVLGLGVLKISGPRLSQTTELLKLFNSKSM